MKIDKAFSYSTPSPKDIKQMFRDVIKNYMNKIN